MAVFVANGDEAERGDQTGPFVFGGWIGRALDWQNEFAPMWERRVLNADPPLNVFHMTQLASSRWREEHGWTDVQADARIDEAIQVVKNFRGLNPLVCEMDGGHFRRVFGDCKVVSDRGQVGIFQMQPDYGGFLGFALASLALVAEYYRDAERVDFVIERKTTVTHHIENNFGPGLADALRKARLSHLIGLIGDVISATKTRVSLQATDLLLWHYRRCAAGEQNELDARRLNAMLKNRWFG